jgi:Fe-S-cluster-containing dehydrogenase component
MFEKEIEDFIEKVRTRRDFLKMSGKGLAGITLTASVMNLIGCTKEEPTSSEVPTGAAAFVIPKGLLVAQPNRCTGCQRCEMVCTVKNDGKVHPYISRVKIGRSYNYGTKMNDNYRFENGYFGNFLMSPETCHQCEDAKCAAVCPQKAITQSEATGAWTVDEEKCIGCGACTQACPWNMPTIDPEDGKSTKCILCGECADNCITGALSIIPWEKLEAMLLRRGYRLS